MRTQTSKVEATKAVMTAVVLFAAVLGLVAWLRATAPVADTTAVGVPEATVEPGSLLLCDALANDERSDLPTPGRATSGEVLTCPELFDGRTVEYVGEVVGDVLERDGGAWMLVNDDPYALVNGPLGAGGVATGTNSGLSVWLPTPLELLVTTPGRAEVRGDVLHITGTIHRADPDDGGGLTLRADDAELLSAAVELDVPLHVEQLVVALVLGAVALGLVARDRRIRDR